MSLNSQKKTGFTHNDDRYRTCKAIAALAEKINMVSHDYAICDFISFMRSEYLQLNLTDSLRRIMIKAGIVLPQFTNSSESILTKYRRVMVSNCINWGDWNFHLNYRIHLNHNSSESDFDLFFNLVPTAKTNHVVLERIILEGMEIHENNNGVMERRFFDLSILPLNLLLEESVISYFIPPADYLQTHLTKKADPYGIICGHTRIPRSTAYQRGHYIHDLQTSRIRKIEPAN